MFDFVNFVIKQLQRLKKAMSQPALGSFKPDGRSLADVSAILSALGTAKTDDIAREVALNNARGALDTTWAELHQRCVGVYASMKSVYRANESALRAIRRIPKKDETARETLVRAEVTAAVWAALPPMPNTNPEAPFSVGSFSLAEFNGLLADLRTQIETCEGCDSDEDVQQGELAQLARTDTEFVSAATDVTEEFWDAVGVAPGNHQYIVLGVNSRGTGPASAIATVPVAAQAAA